MKLESSEPWQYTKGMCISYLALVTALIESGTIAADDVIKQLERYIALIENLLSDKPDKPAVVETMKMVRDAVLKLKSSGDDTLWFSDFIGEV